MCARKPPPDAPDAFDSTFEALLGGGLPWLAELHLQEAGFAYQDSAIAEEHLYQAGLIAPGHAAVLIAYYRYYFYKGRIKEAIDIALLCLEKAALENALPLDWRKIEMGMAAFGSYEAIKPRFLMFSLKAYAYLLLRQGYRIEAMTALIKLLELDPTDKIGAKLLMDIAARDAAEGEDE